MTKTCTKCKKTKPLTEFSKHARMRDGLRCQCKSCTVITSAKYYADNTEKCNASSVKWWADNAESSRERVKAYRVDYYADPANREKKKAYRAANTDKAKARSARWNTANPEKRKTDAAARYAANADKVKARSRAYYVANPEKVSALRGKWEAANPEKARECGRIKSQNRRARKRENGGTLSKELAAKLFGLQRGKCACCSLPLGTKYHLDHIMPLALGGANEDWNIQLLKQRCNNQKHAKHPIDFMQQRGFLI